MKNPPAFSIYDSKLSPALLIDFNDQLFQLSAAWFVFNPLFWNIVARLEYRTHFLTKLFCGSAYAGCYFLAIVIFTLGLARDYVYSLALQQQPTLTELGAPHFQFLAYGLSILGFTLVFFSFFKLGVTGTFLGDYFGILMESKVEGFPFNIMENPMYNGSSLLFVSTAIINKSPAGLLLSLHAFVIYQIAAVFFENPFTNKIYAAKSKKGSQYSAINGSGKKKAKKSQ